MTTAVHDAALAWYQAGACILPAAPDGTKKPGVGSWDRYKAERPSWATTEGWLATAQGIGMVCGAVSGNVEMLELEGAAAEEFLPFVSAVAEADTGLAAELGRYVEKTPGGGYHFLYRVDGPVAGNTKLASRPRQPDDASPSHRQTLMETRGEGGWTVLAPSGGTTHPTGKAWHILAGEPGVIGQLTEAQRDLLHAIAASFDEMPPPEPVGAQPGGGAVNLPAGASAEGTPGADFNSRATWEEILEPAGWRKVYAREGKIHWQRPGKNDRSGSATTGWQGDWLYVFSTSTDFEAERTYTKFGAYALINHNGDYSAAASALRKRGYGDKRPAPVPHLRVVPSPSGEEVSSVEVISATGEVTTLADSEDAHAEVLIQTYGDRIRYCVERSRWYAYDGRRWRMQWPEGMAREYAKRVARSIGEASQAEVRFKRACLSARGTSGALKQAMVDPRIAVSITDFDSQAWELNTPGGTIDLRTGSLHPSNPAHLHTHLTLFTPDFAADRSAWLEFLGETFEGDADLISYVQKLVGYSTVGEVREHLLAFCYGSGGNGKGVFLETIMTLLGEYADAAPNKFLMAGRDKHETEIAALAGTRMVVCSEINDTDRFDEAKVKSLTGGDVQRGRFMRQDFFTFMPSHTLWLVGNADPDTHIGGPSMRRRLKKIPFLHEVEIPIYGLKERLVREHGPAILAWIAEGAASYYRDGLTEPAGVVAATDAYWAEQDTVGRFVAERCKLGGGEGTAVYVARFRDLYTAYCRHEIGTEPVSAKALTQQLSRLGVLTGDQMRTMDGRRYGNVTLLDGSDTSDSRERQLPYKE